METSASFEARYAPLSYPTNRSIEWLRDQGSNLGVTRVQIVTDSRVRA